METETVDFLIGTWELNSHEEKLTIVLKADKTYHSEYIIKGNGTITKTNGRFELVDLGIRLLILYNPSDKIKTTYEIRELSDNVLKVFLDSEELIIFRKTFKA